MEHNSSWEETVPRLVQKCRHVTQPKCSLLFAQQSVHVPVFSQATLSNPISLGSAVILPQYLCVDIPGSLFTQYFSNKIFYGFTISPHASACYCIPTALDFITQIISGELYKAWRSSSCSLLHPPVPNIPHTLSSRPNVGPSEQETTLKAPILFLYNCTQPKRSGDITKRQVAALPGFVLLRQHASATSRQRTGRHWPIQSYWIQHRK